MTPRLQTGKLRLSRTPAAQGPAAGRWIWAQSPGLQGPFSALKAQVPLVPTLQQAGDQGGPPSHLVGGLLSLLLSGGGGQGVSE